MRELRSSNKFESTDIESAAYLDSFKLFLNSNNPVVKRLDIAQDVQNLLAGYSVQLLSLNGSVEPNEIPIYLNACVATILCSDSEGSPMVIKEAMACGLPVAAYPVTGPIDVIGNSNSGVMHTDLREACLQALHLSRNDARSHAEKFSWQVASEQFLKHLKPVPNGLIQANV